MFSSHAVDGHQMYSGGSLVGKTSTIGIEISLTPPLIFTGGSKSAKFGVVYMQHHSTLSRSKQDVRILKQKYDADNDRLMSWPSLVKLGSRTPEKALSVVTHPLKLHSKTC